MLKPETYTTWKRAKASQAIPGELKKSPHSCWEQCCLSRLFHGEEFLYPLKKQQIFVFMGNSKIPHFIWNMQNPHSTTDDFLCRKEAGKLYHLPEEGTGPLLFGSRRADFSDLFHLQILLSDHSKLHQR